MKEIKIIKDPLFQAYGIDVDGTAMELVKSAILKWLKC